MDKNNDFSKDDKFRQDESSNLQKSVNPDANYMKDLNLCRLCHGYMKVCNRQDCPQKV